ncbi:MAG: hypothetical protein H0W10_08275 [Chloroflexi bacterium]|nr:hypothetical protein [Chloroflexota bacterium]
MPKDDEVLVKIDATTVSRTDCGLRSAKPFISRFLTGLRRPRRMILGIDRSYPLEQVVEATNYVETGQKTGNVVLAVANDRGT